MIVACLILMIAGILLIRRAKRWEGYLLTLASLLLFVIGVFRLVVPYWMTKAPEEDWVRHLMIMQGIEFLLFILLGVAVLYIAFFAIKLYRNRNG